jgi:isopentenyl-diphosphate delta-isomerase
MDKVILVDSNDKVLGSMDKMAAHQNGGHLHRAISVFILNSNGEWLIQRRAMEKYHSKGLWSNSACSHPSPGETSIEAANRRLRQEMGMDAQLFETFNFVYKAELENQLTEYELDHVFVGYSDDLPQANPNEVLDFKYIRYEDLKADIKQNPNHYTFWFKKIFQQVHASLKQFA